MQLVPWIGSKGSDVLIGDIYIEFQESFGNLLKTPLRK